MKLYELNVPEASLNTSHYVNKNQFGRKILRGIIRIRMQGQIALEISPSVMSQGVLTPILFM